ncbi:MAG: hypothetical protein IPH93_11965 [Saprospiraceae bacterium]|nr:hypothetical protein [Saprospiraceae bacterium]MBK7812671.1 hypothetical protein [Saprospiraceae bacterium]MBK9630862.1 hypothetical protein [Saprospiraceae bacterium]
MSRLQSICSTGTTAEPFDFFWKTNSLYAVFGEELGKSTLAWLAIFRITEKYSG